MKKEKKEKRFVAIEEETGKSYFGEDADLLMEKLAKEFKGSHFFIKSLDTKYKFLMKKGK